MISLQKKIILASSSPRRRDILRQMGIAFDIVESSVEEKLVSHKEPAELVSDLAYLKAKDVAEGLVADCLVIGADTIVYKDRILGKAKNRQQAFEMLDYLQGGWHQVITGLALIDRSINYSKTLFEISRVKMMPLLREQIEEYLDTGEYIGKAGSYAIQARAAAFISKIDGCYFNIVGLPASSLYKELNHYKQLLATGC